MQVLDLRVSAACILFFAVRHFVSGMAGQFLIGNFHYSRRISRDIARMSPRPPANTPTESIPKSRGRRGLERGGFARKQIPPWTMAPSLPIQRIERRRSRAQLLERSHPPSRKAASIDRIRSDSQVSFLVRFWRSVRSLSPFARLMKRRKVRHHSVQFIIFDNVSVLSRIRLPYRFSFSAFEVEGTNFHFHLNVLNIVGAIRGRRSRSLSGSHHHSRSKCRDHEAASLFDE